MSATLQNVIEGNFCVPKLRAAFHRVALLGLVAWGSFGVSATAQEQAKSESFCSLLSDELELKTRWHSSSGGKPGESWRVENKILYLEKGDGSSQGGNILSVEEYGDFELEFDFKNSVKGNSGVKYRVAKFGDHWLGFEYQIYDEASFDDVPLRGVTGAIYDLYEPIGNKPLHPPGEWNHAKIVAQGNRLEHWLNGVLIAKAELRSEEWSKRYQESKFNDTPGFGLNAKGKLMITDHGSQIWIRNVKLRELKAQD